MSAGARAVQLALAATFLGCGKSQLDATNGTGASAGALAGTATAGVGHSTSGASTGGGAPASGSTSASSSTGGTIPPDSTQGEEQGNQCASQPLILTGTRPAGGSCGQATDCGPTCCTCQNGTLTPSGRPYAFSAAACSGGRCAAPAGACGDVEASSYGSVFCP